MSSSDSFIPSLSVFFPYCVKSIFAIDLKPGYAGSYIARANYYVQKKEFGPAAKDIEEAFKYMDNTQDKSAAYYNITEVYILMGDFKAALEYLKEYIAYTKDAYVFTDDYVVWSEALDKGIEKEKTLDAGQGRVS